MTRGALIAWSVLVGCAAQWPDHVDLQPQGSGVEFAMEPPGTGGYLLLGEVVGEAAANDPDAAQQAARNDIRNKAAAMGGVLVTIDENLGEAVLLQNKTRVRLIGRAYKPVD